MIDTSLTNAIKGIKILGVGSYKPDLAVSNSDFSEYIETDDAWITSRTGIKQRRFNADKPNYFMAAEAAKNALRSAETQADEIDMIIVSTATPDYLYTSMACLVQNEIGAVNACAIDISAACTGFINALDIAQKYLACGEYKKILVIASEAISKQIDFNDRSICVLFGDGAGAVVAEASDKAYTSFLGARGDNYNDSSLYCRVRYNSNNPFVKAESGENTPAFINMKGKDVYKFATDIMPKAVNEVCERAGVALSEVDLLIPHQANIRIINTAMKSLDVPMEKVYTNLESTGNISSACIPVCLDELYAAGRITPGMRVCMVAFGAGLTYGAILMEF
jgi:3-oxoacyl-[acyl-carrier-protein] synthase-3